MLDRLYINEIQKELPYSDRRTVKRWCENNGVAIFSDNGSNRLFVLKAEFELAKNRDLISYLKSKYNETIISKILNDEIPFYEKQIKTFESKKKNEVKTNLIDLNYKPIGEYEQNFLNRLQNF